MPRLPVYKYNQFNQVAEVEIDTEYAEILVHFPWYHQGDDLPPKHTYRRQGSQRPHTLQMHRLVMMLSMQEEDILVEMRSNPWRRIHEIHDETRRLQTLRFVDGNPMNCRLENIDSRLGKAVSSKVKLRVQRRIIDDLPDDAHLLKSDQDLIDDLILGKDPDDIIPTKKTGEQVAEEIRAEHEKQSSFIEGLIGPFRDKSEESSE